VFIGLFNDPFLPTAKFYSSSVERYAYLKILSQLQSYLAANGRMIMDDKVKRTSR